MKSWEKMTSQPKPKKFHINWDIFWVIVIVIVAVGFVGFVVYMDITNSLDAGVLVDKMYKGPYVTHSTTYITSGKIRIPVRHTHHHSESWWFVVEYDDKHDTWEVSETQYNSAHIGDWVER